MNPEVGSGQQFPELTYPEPIRADQLERYAWRQVSTAWSWSPVRFELSGEQEQQLTQVAALAKATNAVSWDFSINLLAGRTFAKLLTDNIAAATSSPASFGQFAEMHPGTDSQLFAAAEVGFTQATSYVTKRHGLREAILREGVSVERTVHASESGQFVSFRALYANPFVSGRTVEYSPDAILTFRVNGQTVERITDAQLLAELAECPPEGQNGLVPTDELMASAGSPFEYSHDTADSSEEWYWPSQQEVSLRFSGTYAANGQSHAARQVAAAVLSSDALNPLADPLAYVNGRRLHTGQGLEETGTLLSEVGITILKRDDTTTGYTDLFSGAGVEQAALLAYAARDRHPDYIVTIGPHESAEAGDLATQKAQRWTKAANSSIAGRVYIEYLFPFQGRTRKMLDTAQDYFRSHPPTQLAPGEPTFVLSVNAADLMPAP